MRATTTCPHFHAAATLFPDVAKSHIPSKQTAARHAIFFLRAIEGAFVIIAVFYRLSI